MTAEARTQRFVVGDDEVVALATSLGGVWRSALTTVDVTDMTAVARAAARGTRQLYRRGLLREDGSARVLDEQLAVLAARACQPPLAVAYTALAADPSVIAGGEICLFAGGAPNERVIDVVSGLGRHEIMALDRESATVLVVDVARAEIEKEPAGAPDPILGAVALYVTREVVPGSQVLEVSAGQFVVGTFTGDPVQVLPVSTSDHLDIGALRELLDA